MGLPVRAGRLHAGCDRHYSQRQSRRWRDRDVDLCNRRGRLCATGRQPRSAVQRRDLRQTRCASASQAGVTEATPEVFCAAIRIAKEQKSLSLEKRAETTYTGYRRQKASGWRTWIPATSLVVFCSSLPSSWAKDKESSRSISPML